MIGKFFRPLRNQLFQFSITLATAWTGALLPQAAYAWYEHATFMPWVVDEMVREFAQIPDHPLPKLLKQPLPKADFRQEELTYEFIAQILLLHPDAEVRSLRAKDYRELLILAADDPDHGIDKELPDSADPNNDRKYMGGLHGTPSQGFRHMYFGGWKWRNPIATFQMPTRPLGQAPDRIDLIANEAKKKLQQGDLVWGMRLLGWTLHYIQDLTQPFHSAQVPTPAMVPWSSLLAWPPARGFENLVKESTRSITNYHWVYEGYVRSNLLKKETGPFEACLNEKSPTLLIANPRDLAEFILRQSVERSPKLGSELIDLMSTRLRDADVYIPKKQGGYDEARLLVDASLASQRERVNRNTCASLQLAKAASVWLMRWAFNP